LPFDGETVAVANTTGLDADADLAPRRLGHFALDEFEWAVPSIIEGAQSRPIGFRKPASACREAMANDTSDPIQMIGPDAHVMFGDRLQAACKISDCGRGGTAFAIEKKAKSVFEGINLDEIPQRCERCGIASPANESRGEAADLPISVSHRDRADRPEWCVFQQITPSEPVAPRLGIQTERFRKPVPSMNPFPAAIGDPGPEG